MIAVKLDSRGPVFYRCRRAGLRGREFAMLKLRKMYDGARGPVLTAADDRRFTRVGRFLARTKLDEIPQLWNVLRGDMSFVGPRPIRPRFFAELARDLPAYWQRLVVRPGLTGFAQVRGGYETSMADKLSHDLEWIADRSAPLYLRTLAATGLRVLRQTLAGRGARAS
jgi:lipopolysaccharide/colanic/teichoic acid biosynthesis glycosyltransferase